ncbi:MAG: hypothetical protein JWO36_6466 [Myxococcales bacterium]|nr:hypothetical protein [Myxococcales bacterium]
MIARVQRGLETLYRVDTGVEIDDFMINEAARDGLAPQRKPREQLLAYQHSGGEMGLGLFIHPAVLANLHRHDPGNRLDDTNFGDFLLSVEGVSHFIYTVCCARADRPVTQLELELQAEVDKYVTCLLATETEQATSQTLRRRLFGDAEYEPDLDGEERDRYRAANDNAQRYAAWLEAVFVIPRKIPEMLGELRRFYRVGLAAKLAQISRAA